MPCACEGEEERRGWRAARAPAGCPTGSSNPLLPYLHIDARFLVQLARGARGGRLLQVDEAPRQRVQAQAGRVFPLNETEAGRGGGRGGDEGHVGRDAGARPLVRVAAGRRGAGRRRHGAQRTRQAGRREAVHRVVGA